MVREKKHEITSLHFSLCLLVILFIGNNLQGQNSTLNYPIAGTGVTDFYDNKQKIEEPEKGDAFYGQDAHFIKNTPQYKENGDGTVTDIITGLTWQKKPLSQKVTYNEAIKGAKTFALAGYNDWRLPTIKELYSLIMFYGEDPSGKMRNQPNQLTPFINNAFFEFRYGNTSDNERIIDAQYVSSTKYVSTTMAGNPTVFGVNFADGRIKGYPISSPRGEKKFEVLYVRGNKKYGVNNFKDNGDSTVTDKATGLLWSKADSKRPMNWEEALIWVQQKNIENYLGYNDWRLPDAKELQSIVDYSRSPATSNSPSINPIFSCTPIKNESGKNDYPYYWTSTTHANSKGYGSMAVYICFGNGLGWMTNHRTQLKELSDVHGAGCQRSDPKVGDPKDYPFGHGPQGDVRRIYNYVRCVRNASIK